MTAAHATTAPCPSSCPAPDAVRDALDGCQLLPDADRVIELFARPGAAPVSLWGVSPVAPLHLGYDELWVRQKRLVELGARHTVVLADHHAMMTHGLSYGEAARRAQYYEHFARSAGLVAEFVRGSEFQTRVDYVEALFGLVSQLELRQLTPHLPGAARGPGGGGRLRLGACVYVVMQCLDAAYLEADLVFGEAGQKKIYALLERAAQSGRTVGLEHPGIRRRAVRLTPPAAAYIPTGSDIAGKPLRDSTRATRISIHDSREQLAAKVRRMYAPPPGQPIEPGRRHALLACFEHSVFPWRDQPVPVRDESGRWREIGDQAQLARAYHAAELHPRELKQALVECLWQRLAPLQDEMAPLSGWLDPARL